MTACGVSTTPPELADTESEIQRGPAALVYDQGWRVEQHVRLVEDVNADGRADLVGFGNEGVFEADGQASGFATPALVVTDLGNGQGWTPTTSVRTLADVNGDHRLDAVAFGPATVMVALKNAGAGYAAPTAWSTDYTFAGGWRVDRHALLVGDVDADGRADLVGIDDWGVYVSRARSTGGFEPKKLWVRAFYQPVAWDATKHPRVLADVNDDGRADVVGFGEDGVYVALSTGTQFSEPIKVSPAFGHDQGWRIASHVRVLANVNGDRYPDLVGLGPTGASVALGTGTGFGAATSWLNDLGDATGWISNRHPRFVADVDGDGLDDLVGIKDDHVYLARSTGTAFSAPTAVHDEFTYQKGWRVENHPRYLADVDADGQLDLVGFFGDAVYWDRLTPPVGAPPADWDAPTCSSSRLVGATPRSCEGPWRYTEVERCVSQDASCPQYCSDYKSCQKWENGVVRDPATGTRIETTAIVGSDVRHCSQLCNATGCRTPTCSGTITQPTAACSSAATNRAAQLRSDAAAAITSEPTFDSAAAQSQRVSQAQALVSAATSYFNQSFNLTSTPAPGGTIYRWDERWACSLAVASAKPVIADNDACGCDVFSSSICEHDCGTATRYTDPGEQRPVSPYISAQVCMTGDDLPATTAAEIQAKFERLWTGYQGAPPTTVTPAMFQRAVVTRMKLMYELWGEQLVDQSQPTDQLHRAVALYTTYPTDNPSCVPDVDAPAAPPSCHAPAVTGTRSDLIRCQRLRGQHASEGVASIALNGCLGLVSGYLDLAADAGADLACGGAHLRDVGARTAFQLEDKQLGLATTGAGMLGELPRQLWLFDRWYEVARRADDLGTFPAADQQRRDTSYLLGRLWDSLRAHANVNGALTDLSGSATTEEAEAALGLTAVRHRQAEQAVVTALFQVPGLIRPENVTLTRPPLRSLPLLAMLGDALKPFVDDLDGLAIYHDIACQFRDCRTPATNTPSRNAWNILASLEASPGLRNAIDATPQPLAAWKAVFGVIATHQDQLVQAIDDAVTGAGGLAGATHESDVEPLARPLWTLYQHARSFHDHYEATGLFESTAQNQLQGSLVEQDQHAVVSGLRGRVNSLQSVVTEYKAGLVAALQAQLALMDTGAHLEDLTNRRLRKAVEMKQKAENLEGLRASGEDEADAFGSLASSFATIQAALDEGAYVQVGDSQTFSLTGQDARFTTSSIPADIAVRTIPNLARGQMLVVQTSGAWAPTCSLRGVRFLKPDGLTALGANLSNAEIGPEGYAVSWNGSSFDAHSSGHSQGYEATLGQSVKYCQTTGTLGDAIGTELEGCIYGDQHVSFALSVNDSVGNEQRSTASFSTGLRLPSTPFPEAPAGSLLVVLTDPQTGAVRDVRVVHGGGTSILIEAASNAYFVVNDKRCAAATTAPTLTVSVRPMTSAVAVAQAALVSMIDVLGYLRGQQQSLARQGTLLPTQVTLLRQQAYVMLQANLGEIQLADLPGPLASLFEAFVGHELVATERRIEMRAIERSLDLDLIDLRTVDDELRAGADRARLQRLVPQWLVRDLDHDALRHRLVDVLGVSRDYLKPILELWYPHALDGVAFGPELAALLNADVDSSLVTLATSGKNFVDALLIAYENATFGAKPNATQLPLVVVSFPRPADVGGTPSPEPDPVVIPWRVADTARARRVWDAIAAHRAARFEITPDDFYSQIGGDAVLSCFEAVPVIKTMGLYIVRPGATSDNAIFNGFGRWFAGLGGATQSFVSPEGPRIYQLASAVWQHFQLPVRYGETQAALTTFLAAPRQTRPVGLSPSGAFDVDFSVLDTLSNTGFEPDNQLPVTEVQLVLELDSRATATRPTWFNRCQ